jgi:hypothetical protein
VRKMILFEKKTRVVGNGFMATGGDKKNLLSVIGGIYEKDTCHWIDDRNNSCNGCW